MDRLTNCHGICIIMEFHRNTSVPQNFMHVIGEIFIQLIVMGVNESKSPQCLFSFSILISCFASVPC